MDVQHLPPELAASAGNLGQLVAIMEGRVPYASALLKRDSGLQVTINNREQQVTEVRPRQGLVLTVWNGAWFEEAASAILTAEHMQELARELAHSVQIFPASTLVDPGPPSQAHFATACASDPAILSPKEKLDMCRDLHNKARQLDQRIVNVVVRYHETKESKAFVNRAKELSQNVLRLRLTLQVFVSDGQQVQYDWSTKEGTGGLELIQFTDQELRELCDNAISLLSAARVPPGMYQVVCTSDVSGVIAHEAFGHGVEMDMFLKGRARSEQYLGKPIASPLVSLVDDPSYATGHGSYFFDDEGQLSAPTYIIRQGIFERGISDLFSAHSLAVPRSANGRRESFERKIYTRMSNTFFARGETPVQALIEGVEHGVYLSKTSSGMEDPKGWGMQVTSHYGEEIAHGRLTGQRYGQVGITGYVPDILQSIDAVGDDFALTGGTCGKGHKEWVPVSSGGPHLRLKARLG